MSNRSCAAGHRLVADDREERQALLRRGARQAEGGPDAAEADDEHLIVDRSRGHRPRAFLVLVRDDDGDRALDLAPVVGHGRPDDEVSGDAFTPKELCHIAQGCSRSEHPCENDESSIVPRSGSVRRQSSDDATLSGQGFQST